MPGPTLRGIRARALRYAVLLAGLVSVPAAAQTADEEPEPRPGEGAVPRGPGSAPATPPEGEGEPAPPQDADAAQVTMPRLTHFENAPYPPQALAAGLEGSVVLALDIDVTGAVTQAQVLQGAGHGFDEAAQAAAMKFRFEPAMRNGQPLAVRIQYQYRFNLPEAPVPPPESRPPPPPIGNLGGVVRIGAEEEAPLASATVLVVGSNGAAYQAVTDAEGKWLLAGLPAGRYKVTVKAEGFSDLEVTEDVAIGEATDTTYRLEPKTEGYEIVVRGERPPREVTRRTIERREMARVPGTSGDALRSIQSLPGVARPPGFAGLLIVRGSAPQDTRIVVDGSEVPLIYHFGGLTSAVPTELLEKIDFYPGNFSARYGRGMGGIIDVTLRAPNTECLDDEGQPTGKDGCFHGLAQVDLIDTRALLQGPIAGGWTFAIAGRRSWIDTWLKPALEEAGSSVTSAPVYYDYQIIVNNDPGDDSEFSLRFFGSDDAFELIITDPSAQEPGIFGGRFVLGTSFYRAQALYRSDLSRAVELKGMLAVGRSRFDFGLGQLRFDGVLHPVELRSELGFKLLDGLKINVGQDILVAPYDVFVRAPAPPRPGEPDPGPFTGRRLLESSDSGTAYRPAWYAEGEIKPTARSLIVPGLRVDYSRDSGQSDLSPRINGRYDLIGGPAENDGTAPPRRRTTLKGGVGLFTQPPEFQETDEVFGTPGLESNRSVHYSLGVEQEFTDNIEVSVEGYLKEYSNLVSRAEQLGGTFQYANEGSGRVYGLETLLKYKADKRFFGWLAYTLSRSVRQDSPAEEERLFQFDQTHNLTVLGSYRLGRGWEFGARFRIISGPLTTPVLQPPGLPAIFAADAGSYAPLQGEPFSQRLPLFHQLDLRIDKSWQLQGWRLSAFLDLYNAYNNPAVEGLAYNYNFTRTSYTTGIPILPSIGMRGEF